MVRASKKYCILFAGTVGSSKTPLAYYLSSVLNLSIFSNDAIRTEVAEDLLAYNQQEYIKRQKQRLEKLLANGHPFIYDASIDRSWEKLKELLRGSGYEWFIVSIDLGKEFLSKLYQAKGYQETLERIDSLLADHENFLAHYSQEANIHITDQNFKNRLVVAKAVFARWLKEGGRRESI